MKLFVQTNSQSNIKELMSLGIEKVVVGMEQFSCRQATSLSYTEVAQATTLSGDIYVLVNALVEEEFISALEEHIHQLHLIGVKGILFQDFAVLQICKEKGYTFDCIYAPDTLNTNHQTLDYLKTLGVTGAFLAREISLVEKIHIQQQLSIPCLMQIHGVEYMAHSKRKLLQNYFEVIGKNVDTKKHEITIKANNIEDRCYIYEDQYGTHVVTKTQLLSLDVLEKMTEVAFGYIESLYLGEKELLAIVKLYLEALAAIEKGTYQKMKDILLEQLIKIQPGVKYYYSFLFDQTVYKIADVRKREEDEKSK